MEMFFSRHARRQMKWRKISRDEVLQVIKDPELEEGPHEGKINVFRTINGRHLKITIKEIGDQIVVVTALLRRKGINQP